ncbi:dihydroxyacetone kinase subunit DhaL [Amycolatopsis jiangsuensis]|uniref:Dihydroxyacetone kinase n=1 Tax=Amycolatopsis jiangsuensis TaxID=1181879 RepID=A0A840IQL0_9PSEU|nr:dihydroxyacetone kinase subunit DhaL [Amycolatopsis jiangsuensis]MBB4683468.1 dihydroxyacetone kinase [Amycolatopsis jiangsuensis]
MNELPDTAAFARWIGTFAASLTEHEAHLNALDAAIGDADHGVNLRRGALVLATLVRHHDFSRPEQLLRAVGSTIVDHVGGASGPLYGSFFVRMAAALATTTGAVPLVGAMRAGVAGVAELGGAEPGDKTLYDALAPAVDALESALSAGQSPARALARAAAAAEAGRDATIAMIAKKGRASYLGERSAGHQDPGATSAALLIAAARTLIPSTLQGVALSGPRFVNDPRSFVADSLRGVVANAADLRWVPDPGYLVRETTPPAGRVALVSGGGSGHEPLHAGFVGEGMLTAAAPGLIFSSPNAVQIHAATAAAHAGAGVVHIVKNYTGDVLNFAIAAELAAAEGIAVETVVVDDDVASDRDGEGPGRRGTAATLVVEKICGAAAQRGDALADVAALGRRTAAAARSMAVALRAPILPGETRPSFDLAEGEAELGIGIHGERGTSRIPSATAGELVAALVDPIVRALGLSDGDDTIVVVNGLGATHDLELSLVFAEVADRLAGAGVRIRRSLVGTFVTALDMSGVSVTLVRVDDEMLDLFDAPTAAPAWPNVPPVEFSGIGDRRPPEITLRVPAAGSADDPVLPPPGDDDLSHHETVAWLQSFADRVIASEPQLTDLDRSAGDGDFGATQLAALTGLGDLAARGYRSLSPLFQLISESYLVRAGGTSGALFGMFFRAFARATAQAGSDGIPLTVLAAASAEGLRIVRELGGASAGDRTMIDALEPAVTALEQASREGASLPAALAAAAGAADSGVRATAEMTARRGRASYLGDSARGVVDPGAVVVHWFFDTATAVIRDSRAHRTGVRWPE